MSTLFLPQSYQPLLSVKETEQAIMRIKEYFQTALSTARNGASVRSEGNRPE